MKRRSFLQSLSISSASMLIDSWYHLQKPQETDSEHGLKADLVIIGGGLGGVAAALSALENGLKVILTEETPWIGGQISQQGVPPDEHRWIETHGAPLRYRKYRSAIRAYYLQHYPLTTEAKAKPYLNPGNGAVSRLCCEPMVAWQVLLETLMPYISNRSLMLLTQHQITSAEIASDQVKTVQVIDKRSGKSKTLEAPYFVDATELGDLLPLTQTEYITGAESKAQTQELHAANEADPSNQQAFTMCFAMDYLPGENLVIDRPEKYNYWKDYIPKLDPPWSGHLLSLQYSNPKTLEPKSLGFNPTGKATGDMLNLWNYRRIIDRSNFHDGRYSGDITIVNWPQNDYLDGPLIDVPTDEMEKHIRASKQLSLSLFYWLQTEAPRPDGKQGWPGLRLRGDVVGSDDGMALYPYIRESRRIKAHFTIREEHVGKENRKLISGEDTAAEFPDSVGIGYYHIDLHPSTGGNNYIDFASLPFQIPLGALLPIRTRNLLPANKNIGTTHITNGCYRLHPVEWSIGEAVGLLAVQALRLKKTPVEIYETSARLQGFQDFIRKQGVETRWPD